MTEEIQRVYGHLIRCHEKYFFFDSAYDDLPVWADKALREGRVDALRTTLHDLANREIYRRLRAQRRAEEMNRRLVNSS
jgi:hypothetical protein